MRFLSIVVCALASGAYGQSLEEAYQQIELSLNATQAAVRVQIQATGWTRVGSTTTNIETRIWREQRVEPDRLPDRLYVESYVDGALRHSIVADGRQVWRYDQQKNEYSFIPQSAGPADAISTAIAWIRQEAQRPLRLLIPRNYRWLTMPEGAQTAYGAEIRQVAAKGGDWRGTYLFWYFAPTEALGRLEIYEKFDLPGGNLQETYMDVRLTYPTQGYTFEFLPKIPANAKPAQDLPRRIGG